MNLKNGSPDSQTYFNISLPTFEALGKGAEFHSIQAQL